MPAPPPPIKRSSPSMDAINVAEVDVNFDDDDRSGSYSRPVAQPPRPGGSLTKTAPLPPPVLDREPSPPPEREPPPPLRELSAPPPLRELSAPPPLRELSAPPPLREPSAPPEPEPPPSLDGVAAPISIGPSSRGEVYAAGDTIAGKYRLKNIIGRGGMGSVWLAHNLALDIDIAIKLIRRDRAAPGAAVRLQQEARAAARLRHPAIVRVSDFGETARGDPFIVMELLHGEPLSTVIARKGRFSPYVAVQTLLPVASALVEAHAKGIVHRDLKPDNILLVTDETGAVSPKVVDFGIAKLMDKDIDRQLTMAGEVLGSPDYMSPEQARGDEDVGERTDVWALAVVFYEAITGRRPFDGPNYNALIAAILTANPIPASEFCDCDGDLWSILARGLDKDDATRWATMRDFGTALAGWVVDRGIEDDVNGASIAKQWIIGKSRRLFSVFPEGETTGRISLDPPIPAPRPSAPERPSSPDRSSVFSRPSFSAPPSSAPGFPPGHPSNPGYPPGFGISGISSPPGAPVGSPAGWAAGPAASPSRAPWIALAVVFVLGGLGFVGVMLFFLRAPAAPTPSAPGPSAAPPAAPSAVVNSVPSVSPSAAPLDVLSDTPSGTPSDAASADPKAPQPSASGSAKAAGTGTAKTPRPKTTAPKVPKHINF